VIHSTSSFVSSFVSTPKAKIISNNYNLVKNEITY
jgi:hypothetical protein